MSVSDITLALVLVLVHSGHVIIAEVTTGTGTGSRLRQRFGRAGTRPAQTAGQVEQHEKQRR